VRRSMKKSQNKILETLEALIDEYSAFQRSRPDLPQGNLRDLTQEELDRLVSAFQVHKSEREAEARIPTRLH
jgi:hypothetical protein